MIHPWRKGRCDIWVLKSYGSQHQLYDQYNVNILCQQHIQLRAFILHWNVNDAQMRSKASPSRLFFVQNGLSFAQQDHRAEVLRVLKALPYFSLSQLIDSASHFGQQLGKRAVAGGSWLIAANGVFWFVLQFPGARWEDVCLWKQETKGFSIFPSLQLLNYQEFCRLSYFQGSGIPSGSRPYNKLTELMRRPK